ncbi:hypothetical protein V6N13_032182 [Hibiscus sabdariffa]
MKGEPKINYGLEFEPWECSTLGVRGTKPSGSCHTSSGLALSLSHCFSKTTLSFFRNHVGKDGNSGC